MTKQAYLEKRNALMNEAEKAIENSDLELYNAKEKEIKALDEQFENITKALANMNSLKDNKVNLSITGSLPGDNNLNEQVAALDNDIYASKEYRVAFMNFARTGVMDNNFKNSDEFTTVADAAAVIPTTIMEEVIKKAESYGQLFSRIRKTNVKGGVQIPISSLKPVAKWIDEVNQSDRQKVDLSQKISFSYFGLECKVAVSLLADITTLSIFESTFTTLLVEAIVKALEISFIKGTGTGQPLGITKDSRVPEANKITLSAADFVKWDAWKKKVFAKIPLAYRSGGSWIMAAGTFEGYVDGMVDANGQPIGRVNYGIVSGPQERFGGREVILVEDDIVSPYESAAADDVVAVFCKLSDYCLNSNLQMQMIKWTDNDSNQKVNKILLVADGKIVDPNGVIIVKKGA